VRSNYPVVTSDEDSAAIVERFWLTSEGIYIYVEPYVPLFINANATGDNQLCFVAKFEEPFKAVPELRLHYQVCSLSTANQAHMHALTSVLNGRPSDLPDERMVRHPIWSTWARYKRDINDSVVLSFAQEILDHGFNNSQLEIDDDWETCYGELTFDSNKFPNPAAMSRRLKELGFRVTLWIHPFINERCPSFNAFKEAGYLVSDGNGNTRTSWWNGAYAGIIDFSNPETLNWFLERLREIKTISEVDSFKFDAGEAGWMPKPRELTGDLDLQPNSYTVSYIRALQEFGPLTEIRTGFQTQDLPLFVRMIDKDSHWGLNNGLRSIVTTLLVMSNAGYPYILPDMIGGNSYGIDILTDELFVRWLQASTFMPSLQFSYVPWSFNNPQVIYNNINFLFFYNILCIYIVIRT
jgi:alpha-glucosidase